MCLYISKVKMTSHGIRSVTSFPPVLKRKPLVSHFLRISPSLPTP